MATIDLNSDLGENTGTDEARVLAQVTSANIACGFHAGDPRGIRATCRSANEFGVVIGAHPGYNDFEGFGRRMIEVDLGELTDQVIYQIGAIDALARSVGAEIRYVKPHGGLYNAIAVREDQARAVTRAILELDDSLPLMVQPGSVVERVARDAGLLTVAEAFADRGYTPDGRLIARGEPGALLDSAAAVRQAVKIATEGRVFAVDGSEIEVRAESICLHGDNPATVRLSAEIRAALSAAGVDIRSFVRR